MDPFTVMSACAGAASAAYGAVKQVHNQFGQWQDASFNIQCLHTDVVTAETYLVWVTGVLKPQLAFVPPDVVTAILRSFTTCQHALEKIISDAGRLSAVSRRDQLLYVWKESQCERHRIKLKDQMDALRMLVDIVQM
ncbi:hypothetical protein MMC19_001498 [Ptychographa xylographoides]|nr:hypothetical protein [Ptychographa xylographoides]